MAVSLRAYARHRGVSLGAVQKAIKAGRIQKTSSGQIDVEAADAQWERNTAPRPSGDSHQQKPTASPTLPLNRPSQTGSAEKNTDLGRNDLPAAGSLEYSRARAVREGYNARLTKLDFELRTGKLVSRDEVEVEAFNRYRTFRDGMLNIPNRLAAVVAAENDPSKVHELLDTEIRKALQEFANGNSR